MAAILKMMSILDFQLDIMELMLEINYSTKKNHQCMPLTAKEGELGINFRRNPHIWIWRPFCFYANKVCMAHWGIVNNE